MNTKSFEEARWSGQDQKIQFRHEAALECVKSGRVLDLGCGDGLLLSLLKSKGIDGEGLDLSEEGVKKAVAKGVRARAFDFANKALPFGDKSFETVVILDVLEHLYDPLLLLREAARVASEQVIVGVPNFNSLVARIQVLMGRVPENNQPQKGHVYWFNLSVLKAMFEECGLSVNGIRVNTIYEKVPVVGSVTRLLSKIFPSLFALSYVLQGKGKF